MSSISASISALVARGSGGGYFFASSSKTAMRRLSSSSDTRPCGCWRFSILSEPTDHRARSFAGAPADYSDQFFRRLVPNGDCHWSNPLIQI